MIANYHTHTWRCHHATGREEDYVRNAIDRGLKILGFSDHSPLCFPDGYVSGIRMTPEQLTDYCDTVRGLRKQYGDRIAIPLGVEIEYYPAVFSGSLPMLRDAGIEYMILGQHFVGNEMGEPYCGRATGDVSIFRRYCAQAMDAMQTGLITYLAHPDLFWFTGDEKLYRDYMARLCREAKSCGVPLEVNVLGKWSGRHYPARRFWEIAAEEGCSVILGCDAHAPEQLLRQDAEEALLDMIRSLDLKLLETVELRKI